MTTLPKNLMSGVFGLCRRRASNSQMPSVPNHFMLSAVALALLALTASGYGFAVSAEPVPTPLQQARYGVPAEDVECAGDRILMTSPSRNPVCVFAGSAEALERRGFVMSPEVPCGDHSAKQPEASEKTEGTGSPDASQTGRPFVTT